VAVATLLGVAVANINNFGKVLLWQSHDFLFSKYLPIICFIYIGMSRWIKTGDKNQLKVTAVGIYGLLILLSQDNANAILEFTHLCPVDFYIIFGLLDLILVLVAILLIRLEILKKGPSSK
jgi:hypothetical protein